VARAKSQRVTWPAAEAVAKSDGCVGDHAASATLQRQTNHAQEATNNDTTQTQTHTKCKHRL
jgi:hypothetical protein